MIKIRQIKNSYKDFTTRFQVKYKKLHQTRYNILATNKLFKFHHPKWGYLKKMNLRRFRLRLFTKINTENNLQSISTLAPIFNPHYTFTYKKLLHTKRCFTLWYRIKRMKTIQNLYFKTFNIIQGKHFFFLTRLTSLFYQYERRLDVILTRAFFFQSLLQIQKSITQKNFLVNSKEISYFNIYLNIGDIIEIKKNRLFFLNHLKTIIKQKYKPKFLMLLNYFHLEINYNILTIRLQKPIIQLQQIHSFFPFNLKFHRLKAYLDSKL